MIIIIDYPNILNVSWQESEHITWISTTNKWNNNTYTKHITWISTTNKWNNNTYTTNKWIIMTFSAERTSKGKALAQDYSQEKRLQRDNIL